MRYIRYNKEKQQVNFLNCNKLDNWIDTCQYRGNIFYDVCEGDCECSERIPVQGQSYSLMYYWDKTSYDSSTFRYNGKESTTMVNPFIFSPEELTSLTSAFCDSHITELVNMPDTSKVEYMNFLFSRCGDLHNINGVGEWDTSSLLSANYAFSYLTSLREIDLSSWNMNRVTSLMNLFASSTGLQRVNLSGWNLLNLTHTSYMFNKCENLEEINLSGWNAPNLTNISNMFDNCKKLKSVNVEGLNTSRATSIMGMFGECWELEELDLSSWDVSNISDMRYAFYKCYKLQSLNLNGWDLSSVSGYNEAFTQCTSLRSIYMYGCSESSVNLISICLLDAGIRSNVVIYWDGMNEEKPEGGNDLCIEASGSTNFTLNNKIFYVQESPYCVGLSELNISQLTDLTQAFASSSERNPKPYTKIVFNEGFDTSQVTAMTKMFNYSSGITELDISHFNTSNVTSMSQMFDGCRQLKEIDLSNFDTSNVTNLFALFTGCEDLTKVDLSNFNTSNVTNVNYLFLGCSGLTEIDLSNWDLSKVRTVTYMFRECFALETLYLRNVPSETMALIRNQLEQSPNKTNTGYLIDQVAIIT